MTKVGHLIAFFIKQVAHYMPLILNVSGVDNDVPLSKGVPPLLPLLE